jgi:hypothetical protein
MSQQEQYTYSQALDTNHWSATNTETQSKSEKQRFTGVRKILYAGLVAFMGFTPGTLEAQPVQAAHADQTHTTEQTAPQPDEPEEVATTTPQLIWPGINDGGHINIQEAVGHLATIVEAERAKSTRDGVEGSSKQAEAIQTLAQKIYDQAYTSTNLVRVTSEGLPVMFAAGQLLSSMGEDADRKSENQAITRSVLAKYLSEKGTTAPQTIDPENIVKLAAVLLALDTEQPLTLQDGTILTDTEQLTPQIIEQIFGESSKGMLSNFTIGPNPDAQDTTIFITYSPQAQ